MNKAKVEYLVSRTLNMGNFESTKIQVGISMECVQTPEEIELAFSRAKRFVDAKVVEQEHEWKVGEDE